jgi:hypothetical protein
MIGKKKKNNNNNNNKNNNNNNNNNNNKNVSSTNLNLNTTGDFDTNNTKNDASSALGSVSSNVADDIPISSSLSSSIVLGWQLMWTSDVGSPEIESKPRGSWHSAGIQIHEIAVPKDDYVVGMDYLYDGPYMTAIRCKYFHTGYSKWIGGKTSMSTLSVSLIAENAPKEPFENERTLGEEEKRSPALPYNMIVGFSGLIYNNRVTCLGLVVRKIYKQYLFSYYWIQDYLEQKQLKDNTEHSKSLDFVPSINGIHSLPSQVSLPGNIIVTANGAADQNAMHLTDNALLYGGVVPQESLTLSHASDIDTFSNIPPGADNQHLDRHPSSKSRSKNNSANKNKSKNNKNQQRGKSANKASRTGGNDDDEESEDDEEFADEDDYDDSFMNDFFGEDDFDFDLDDDDDEDEDDEDQSEPGGKQVSSSKPQSAVDSEKEKNQKALKRSQRRANRNKKKSWSASLKREEYLRKKLWQRYESQYDENGVLKDESLTHAEQQFFDTVRMRMTELAHAENRVMEFVRRLWSNKKYRDDPNLAKLVSLRVLAPLTRWFFNSLSRNLLRFCYTEKQGLQYHKQAHSLKNKALSCQRYMHRMDHVIRSLEHSVQPWMGKALLGPAERAQKKQHQQHVQDCKNKLLMAEKKSQELMLQSYEMTKISQRLLPKISLSKSVYNNFKNKIYAARHKENLLERMTMDNIKNGLFGANSMKETILDRDQMQSIHRSLKDRKLEMKDLTSLSRLVDFVLSEEEQLITAPKTNTNTASNTADSIAGRLLRRATTTQQLLLSSSSSAAGDAVSSSQNALALLSQPKSKHRSNNSNSSSRNSNSNSNSNSVSWNDDLQEKMLARGIVLSSKLPASLSLNLETFLANAASVSGGTGHNNNNNNSSAKERKILKRKLLRSNHRLQEKQQLVKSQPLTQQQEQQQEQQSQSQSQSPSKSKSLSAVSKSMSTSLPLLSKNRSHHVHQHRNGEDESQQGTPGYNSPIRERSLGLMSLTDSVNNSPALSRSSNKRMIIRESAVGTPANPTNGMGTPGATDDYDDDEDTVSSSLILPPINQPPNRTTINRTINQSKLASSSKSKKYSKVKDDKESV